MSGDAARIVRLQELEPIEGRAKDAVAPELPEFVAQPIDRWFDESFLRAVDELLESFRRDREWNDEAAKKQLFTIFEALPPKDPIALAGRRRLSSMIFA